EAVERARNGDGPTLIEALTYRMGPHTTSDDPSRYRDESVTEAWKKKDPIARLRLWLVAQGMLTDEGDQQLRAAVDAEVREAVAAEEHAPPPPLHSIVEQVFAEVPPFL